MSTDTSMQRNKPMRTAMAVMIAAMISTCAISGVLAKYITTDNATDTARVAKFGVVASASGDLFGKSYAKNVTSDDGTTGVVQKWSETSDSVSSAGPEDAAENLFAPGTNNLKGMTFSVKGTPEVTTKLTLDVAEGVTGDASDKDYANSDVFLKKGEYSVMQPVLVADVEITDDNAGDFFKYASGSFTQLTDKAAVGTDTTVYKRLQLTGITDPNAAVSDTADVMSADYYPIHWSVEGTENTTAKEIYGADAMKADTVDGSIANAVKADLMKGADTTERTRTPNDKWDNKSTVTWKWDFSDASNNGQWKDESPDTVLHNWENTTLVDLEDTVLGDLIYLAKGSTDFKIASGLTEVKFAEIDAASDSANKVYVAYTGDSAPTTLWKSDGSDYNDAVNVACLTAAYGERVTVEQVD